MALELRAPRQDIVRVKNLNSRITFEILNIKRHDVLDAVNIHRRHKPGIVDFDAGNSMGDHQPFPFRKDCGRLGKNTKEGFTSS
jgi:hypothetical protein